jgi:D-3-phosphoglycerate dehydrogenase
VNAPSGTIAEDVRPGIALVEKLGRVFTALATGVPTQFDVEVKGEITEHDVSVLKVAALRGLFSDVVEEQVTFVNAPVLAADRGTEVRLLTDADGGEFRNVITLRGTLADGSQLSVSGTLTGPKQIEKLVGIDGLDLEVPLAAHFMVLRYADRPGVIGNLGRLLGDAGVNIAAMQVARGDAGGEAVSVLTLDSTVPAATLEEVAREVEATSVRVVDLED